MSKRWNRRSVSSFDFDLNTPSNLVYEIEKKVFSRFLRSVKSFLHGRDMDQPLHRLRFICSSIHNQSRIERCIEDVLRITGSLERMHRDTCARRGMHRDMLQLVVRAIAVIKLQGRRVLHVWRYRANSLKETHVQEGAMICCRYSLTWANPNPARFVWGKFRHDRRSYTRSMNRRSPRGRSRWSSKVCKGQHETAISMCA